ncbi:MAG: hypothetical protein VKI82_01645 [Leptolyngbya sp.]|nr:hypothetical protein [Leptolyngbya sp.]
MSDQVSIETLAVSETPSQDLQAIAAAIGQAAQARAGDSVALLALLRLLEQCHREICETRFRDALPSNRHTLYTLLRDIETHGGWPYIQRMKLRTLLSNYPGLANALEPEAEVPPVADNPAFPLGEDPLDAEAG